MRKHNLFANHPFWMYILIFFISQFSAAAVPFVLDLIGNSQAQTSGQAVVFALFGANLLAVILFFLYRPKAITWKSTFAGFKAPNARRSLLCFSLAIPTIFLVNIIQEAFFDLPDLVGEETMRTIMYNPLGFFTIGILGPIAEELLFRGGVQTDLQRRCAEQGIAVAIGLSAACFSLIHLNPAQMPAAFILGGLLGFAYWWTGSLLAPICIHVFNNSSVCILSYLLPNEDKLIPILGGATGAGLVAVVSIFWFFITLQVISRDIKKDTEKG